MITAALFDLGGTLLNFNPNNISWLDWEGKGLEQARQYLSEEGIKVDKAELEDAFLGPLPERWHMATEGKQNLELGKQLYEAYSRCRVRLSDQQVNAAIAHYIQPLDAGVTVYADTLETLQTLHGEGLKLGLISNTMWPGDYHRKEMARLGFLSLFECTVFSADVGTWKPQPEIYQMVLDALDAVPEQAFFVGDTPQHDIVGAQTAGMRAVYRKNARFVDSSVTPDAEITTLSELVQLVEQWK